MLRGVDRTARGGQIPLLIFDCSAAIGGTTRRKAINAVAKPQ
jgi:hypothetical protein